MVSVQKNRMLWLIFDFVETSKYDFNSIRLLYTVQLLFPLVFTSLYYFLILEIAILIKAKDLHFTNM